MVNLSQVKEVILNNKNVEEIQKKGVTLWESPYLIYLIITFNSSLTEYGTNGLIGNNIQYKVDDGEWIDYDGKLSVTGSKLKIKGVTSLGDFCFRNCSGLTSISIPDSITSIGDSCFNWCTSLTSISIPDSITSIGNYCFHRCTSLTSISIPDSITSIGDSCFRNCSGLTSISIPDSITSIGADCFYNCFSLRMITMLPTTPPALSSGSISVTPVTIYVPKGCRTAYMNAPNYPQDATYIELE